MLLFSSANPNDVQRGSGDPSVVARTRPNPWLVPVFHLFEITKGLPERIRKALLESPSVTPLG
ncbi:hypothetical protein CDG81_00780 [Actinopolyspora erythraea]|uniref:Uncharacterized protein n=1 Tax=Actinopolyspora erythraea TaxID=414996 RepID=A0A099DCN7_9ACTN|nr:hypothetical protein CDG81_00780 [Actinopolyspora erythraea]KGI83210.1 hypothetical protein IL38_00905 [Actinopolyspora erythraea]